MKCLLTLQHFSLEGPAVPLMEDDESPEFRQRMITAWQFAKQHQLILYDLRKLNERGKIGKFIVDPPASEAELERANECLKNNGGHLTRYQYV